MECLLINNLDRIHTTNMGLARIRGNIGIDNLDVIEWCKNRILDRKALIERQGKNWYVHIDGYILTVNASSYTVITVHKERCA